VEYIMDVLFDFWTSVRLSLISFFSFSFCPQLKPCPMKLSEQWHNFLI
jgi:hypothetical protein